VLDRQLEALIVPDICSMLTTSYQRGTMRKHILTWILSILLAANLFAAQNNQDTQNAKMFMRDGMYPQAIALWERVVEERPNDAAVHFQLGICHLNLYDFDRADDSFAEAIRLQLDYAYQISDEYMKITCKAISEGKIIVALDAYKKATQYQPDKDVGIDNLCGIEIKEKAERLKALSNEAEKHIREKLDQIAKAIEEIKAKMAQEFHSIEDNEIGAER
jgi:tetratricopeptide (TPR) repeat protein